MVYGELERYPIGINIKVSMIQFWCKIIMGKQSKMYHICYKLLYNKNCIHDFKWFFIMDQTYSEHIKLVWFIIYMVLPELYIRKIV